MALNTLHSSAGVCYSDGVGGEETNHSSSPGVNRCLEWRGSMEN